MIRKFFPLDKNYLLEQAQMNLRRELIVFLIDHCKAFYLARHNPLGLLDATTEKISRHQTVYSPELKEFYNHLCGIYRYRYGKNQLEFLFDGKDHLDHYQMEWRTTFQEWIHSFCHQPHFLRAVLELSVFYPTDRKAGLAANRMKAFMEGHFNLKIYKYRGIVEMRVA